MSNTIFNPLLFYTENNWAELKGFEPKDRNIQIKTYLFWRNFIIFINLFNELGKHETDSFEYIIYFDMILISFRSMFLHVDKKNITFCNYTQEILGYELSEKINAFFDKKIMLTKSLTVTLSKLIRTIVDKFVVHYDTPSLNDIEIGNIGKAYLITNNYIYVLFEELIDIIRPATEKIVDAALKEYLDTISK